MDLRKQDMQQNFLLSKNTIYDQLNEDKLKSLREEIFDKQLKPFNSGMFAFFQNSLYKDLKSRKSPPEYQLQTSQYRINKHPKCQTSQKHCIFCSFLLIWKMTMKNLTFVLQIVKSFDLIQQIIYMCFEKNRKSWALEEESLLKQLYEANGPKSWKKISKELKKHGYRRKEIQVRQKWINHMDPYISNQSWKHEELQILYRAFDNVGSKWCLIKKQIPGRTQIKIKNKFYSNVRVYIRFVLLFLQGKNHENKQLINKIPPNVLNQIYQGQKKFEFFGNQFRTILSQMNFEIDKSKLERRIEAGYQLYEKFVETISIVFKQITEAKEFKNILENDQSYYSDCEDDESEKKSKPRGKIGNNLALKAVSSDLQSSVVIEQKQKAVDFGNVAYTQQFHASEWSTVILIQPRKIPVHPVFYYNVYFPWQLVNMQ